MRWIYLALVVAVVSSPGCSAIVASRGVELSDLTTKEQVHRTFGTPVTGGIEGQPGQAYEEFRTHRKISERWKGEYLLIPCVVTLGLSEFVYFPRELFCATRQLIVGQSIRFGYDIHGNVTTVDGGGPPNSIRPRMSSPAPATNPGIVQVSGQP